MDDIHIMQELQTTTHSFTQTPDLFFCEITFSIFLFKDQLKQVTTLSIFHQNAEVNVVISNLLNKTMVKLDDVWMLKFVHELSLFQYFSFVIRFISKFHFFYC